MNINGTTLFLFSLSPPVSAGPQKPQTLNASKTKYERFGRLITMYSKEIITFDELIGCQKLGMILENKVI